MICPKLGGGEASHRSRCRTYIGNRQRGVGALQVGVVQSVQSIDADLELESLPDGEGSGSRHVERLLAGLIGGVAASGTKGRSSVLGTLTAGGSGIERASNGEGERRITGRSEVLNGVTGVNAEFSP